MPNPDNLEVATKEMLRSYQELDSALASWVDTLSPLKRELLRTVLVDSKSGHIMDDLWKPENIRRIGLFYWHSGFPRAAFENMVETYIILFATKFRSDMIPASPDEQEGE